MRIDWHPWPGVVVGGRDVNAMAERAMKAADREGGIAYAMTGDTLVVATRRGDAYDLHWCLVRQNAAVPK